jgi:hypothetical protein
MILNLHVYNGFMFHLLAILPNIHRGKDDDDENDVEEDNREISNIRYDIRFTIARIKHTCS